MRGNKREASNRTQPFVHCRRQCRFVLLFFCSSEEGKSFFFLIVAIFFCVRRLSILIEFIRSEIILMFKQIYCYSSQLFSLFFAQNRRFHKKNEKKIVFFLFSPEREKRKSFSTKRTESFRTRFTKMQVSHTKISENFTKFSEFELIC